MFNSIQEAEEISGLIGELDEEIKALGQGQPTMAPKTCAQLTEVACRIAQGFSSEGHKQLCDVAAATASWAKATPTHLSPIQKVATAALGWVTLGAAIGMAEVERRIIAEMKAAGNGNA